uniref:Uncharacterized protein n=1 Tax=Physcomitrium patens TaxID=3218 RepID=A0A7I4DV13_PHYPA
MSESAVRALECYVWILTFQRFFATRQVGPNNVLIEVLWTDFKSMNSHEGRALATPIGKTWCNQSVLTLSHKNYIFWSLRNELTSFIVDRVDFDRKGKWLVFTS